MFILYAADLEDVAAKHSVNIHGYTDDTQLYLHSHRDDMTSTVHRLENCITDVGQRMSANRLKLNTEKIEPLRAGYVRYMALQTQIRRDCHSEQTDVFLRRDGVCPELERWTADSHRGLTVSPMLLAGSVSGQPHSN